MPPRNASPVPEVTSQTAPTYTIRPPRYHKRRWVKWTLLSLLVLAIVGAAGWGAVAFFFAPPAALEEEVAPDVPATMSAIIPREASLALQYRVETPQDRAALLQLWQGSPQTFLQGNPSDVLRDPGTSQILYVMLAGETRPFALMPHSDLAEEIIAQSSNLQSVNHEGWIIAHSFNPGIYKTALAAGALEDTAAVSVFNAPDSGVARFYLGQTALNQIRKTSFGDDFTVGRLSEVAFAGHVRPQENVISLQGIGLPASGAPASISPQREEGDQHLFSLVPADAASARLGYNLTQDVASWQEMSQVLDEAVLSQPAVAALMEQFTSPYAWYHRLGADGLADFGLIVTLPAGLQPELQLGDASLEQALRALIPLVTKERLISELAFFDGELGGVPIRFVNLTGPADALDYTLTDSHLLIASSKEGMEVLLGSAAAGLPAGQAGLKDSAEWGPLFTAWGALPSGRDVVVAAVNYPPLSELLPASQFGLVISTPEAADAIILQGVLVLDTL